MSAAPCLALELDPVADDGDDIDAFTLVGLVTPTDPVVGPETLSTAGGSGVLGAEDGVTWSYFLGAGMTISLPC